jgi:hypothetical protein
VARDPDDRPSARGTEKPSGGGGGSGGGGDDRKAFLLRLPPPLLAELRAWASQDLRSLNGQIEYLLREAVRVRRKGGSGS